MAFRAWKPKKLNLGKKSYRGKKSGRKWNRIDKKIKYSLEELKGWFWRESQLYKIKQSNRKYNLH